MGDVGDNLVVSRIGVRVFGCMPLGAGRGFRSGQR